MADETKQKAPSVVPEDGTSPVDTLPSGGGVPLQELLGEEAAAAIEEARARRRAGSTPLFEDEVPGQGLTLAPADGASDEASAMTVGDMPGISPASIAAILPAAPNAAPNAAPAPEPEIDAEDETHVATYQELEEAEIKRLREESKRKREAEAEAMFDDARTEMALTPLRPIGPAMGPKDFAGGATLQEDDLIIFEEDSESTVFTPYAAVVAEAAKAEAAKAEEPIAEVVEEVPAPQRPESESTSFDDPELKSIRDRLMQEAREKRQAERIQKATPAPPQAALNPADGLATMVDSQLSEDDLRKLHSAAVKTPGDVRQAVAAPSERRVSGSPLLVIDQRDCLCDIQATEMAVVALSKQTQTGSRVLFVAMGWLFALAGSAGMLYWGIPRLAQFQGILGFVLAGLGLGVLAGVCLSLRAQQGQEHKLLLESVFLALLSAGVIGASLLVKELNFFHLLPHGMALQQPWGLPFVRESLVWFVCIQAGLIGGWSFRLKSNSMTLLQGVPDYAKVMSDFQDPDMERAGCSYNDVLLRSEQELKCLDASAASSAAFKCFYCFRDAATLCKESQGSRWLHWMIACPHCSEKLCIQHFADNAWQCRSCGKSIRNKIRRCGDCPPGQLPEGQRAVLCPHCHQWKGCQQHAKARGGKCPVCTHDIKVYTETYGRL